MKTMIAAMALCLGMTSAACAADQNRRHTAADMRNGYRTCTLEVLRSEELPGAPIFQNLVRATLRVNAPGAAPFETTVVKLIPSQMPPPRQGQRLTVPCDPASLNSSSSLGFRIFH